MPEISASQVSTAARRAGANALNKVGITARANAVRAITDKYNVKAADVKKLIEIRKATPNNPELLIIVHQSNRMPLIKFPAKQLTSGTVVRVQTDRSMIVRHAFIQTMQSGHMGVFIRKGPKRAMKRGIHRGLMRQPIVEMAGPRITTMYRKSDAVERVKDAAKKLVEVLEHEMKYALSKVRGSSG